MSTDEMVTRVKAALLECATKSEELEEAASQLTVQKLRSHLAIEVRLGSLQEELKTAGQQLLGQLASHHDSCQAKIHEQQLMVLKYNMQLSSAMAKEMVSEEMCKKVEENLVPVSTGFKAQFVPSKLNISTSGLGFIQLGHYLPSQVALSHQSTKVVNEEHTLTCILSSTMHGDVQALKKFLVVEVRRDEEFIEHDLEYISSSSLKLSYVCKNDGLYCVSASLYGEMVQGSPLMVEILDGSVNVSLSQGVMGKGFGGKFGDGDDALLEEGAFGDFVKEAYGKTVDALKNIKGKLVKNVEETKKEIGEDLKVETIDSLAKEVKIGESVIDDILSVATEDNAAVDVEAGKADVDLAVTVVSVEEVKSDETGSAELSSQVVEATLVEEVAPPQANDEPVFPVGSSCLVKWVDDNVWCRAKVDCFDKGLYQVTFSDYGDKVSVGTENMVSSTAEIPREQWDMVDPLVWKWSLGMKVVAKWSDDKVWYNGVISGVGGGFYNVMFVDYGNIEVVTEDNIVETRDDIPEEEKENVDVFVVSGDEVVVQLEVTENIIDIKDTSGDSVLQVVPESITPFESKYYVKELVEVEVINEESTAKEDEVSLSPKFQEDATTEISAEQDKSRKFLVGSLCIAEWSDDGTWYNAKVSMLNSDGSYEVEFVDYGNIATVAEARMVTSVEDIPGECNIDKLVKKAEKEVEEPTPELEESVSKKDVPAVKENLIKEGVEKVDLHPKVGTSESGEDGVKNDASTVAATTAESGPDIKRTKSVDKVSPTKKSKSSSSSSNVEDSAWSPTVGSVCCAKWSDRVWYNARVDELLPGGKEVLVTFIDFGNTDKIPAKKLVRDRSLIPKGAKVNTMVKQDSAAAELQDGLALGQECVALWAEDNIWYNARIIKVGMADNKVKVEFFDYGNIDLVSVGDVYNTFSSVMLDRPLGEMTVDPNVVTERFEEVGPVVEPPAVIELGQGDQVVDTPVCEEQVEPLSLKSLVSTDQYGKVMLNALVVNTISMVEGVVGMISLQDGSLVTASEGDNSVKIWSRGGEVTKEVVGDREFFSPTDVVCMEGVDGFGFAVKDKKGVMVFDSFGKFVKKLDIEKLDRSSGMAVDSLGRIVTINKCLEGDEGKLTVRGETDILYIDVKKEKVVKRVEMIDIIADRKESDCKALTMHKDKLYVVDTGLDCIYTLFNEDGEDQAEVFGSHGRRETQFSGVSSVVVDDEGNTVISDTRNNRLQLINSDWEFVGFVKVQPSPLSKPCSMCLDRKTKQLVVHNLGSSEVVRYALGPL